MSRKVWVIQEGRNDYSMAEEYGEVNFITDDDFSPMKTSAQNDRVKSDMRKFRSDYIPGIDFIIPTGNPIVSAIAVMSLSKDRNHNFLKWDGRRACYIPFTLNSNLAA